MHLPVLGTGIVYVPGLEPLLQPGNDSITVLEVEPQTLWHFDRSMSVPYVFPDNALQVLRSLPQRKIIHSVGVAVGGTQRASAPFCAALKHSIHSLDAAWASEHLSFTHVKGKSEVFHTGFMLPSLQTREGAQTAATTIRDLAQHVPVPFAVETGVNYLAPRPGELSDGEFIAQAVEHADCGILLDLHNIWTNERNGRQSVREYLATIPLERVWEIHLGGGFEFEGYWLDAHSGAVPDQVLTLLEECIPRCVNLKAVVYEIFPSFIPLFGLDAVQKQMEVIKTIWEHTQRPNSSPQEDVVQHSPQRVQGDSPNIAHLTPDLWEHTLGELVTHGETSGPLAEELKHDRGVDLTRRLIWKFRASSVVKALPTLTKLIIAHAGPDCLEELLDAYIGSSKPQPFASEEAQGFIRYLSDLKPPIPYLEDILSYELSSMRALIEQTPQYLIFPYNPVELFQALIKGYLPQNLPGGNYELEIPVEYSIEAG